MLGCVRGWEGDHVDQMAGVVDHAHGHRTLTPVRRVLPEFPSYLDDRRPALSAGHVPDQWHEARRGCRRGRMNGGSVATLPFLLEGYGLCWWERTTQDVQGLTLGPDGVDDSIDEAAAPSFLVGSRAGALAGPGRSDEGPAAVEPISCTGP